MQMSPMLAPIRKTTLIVWALSGVTAAGAAAQQGPLPSSDTIRAAVAALVDVQGSFSEYWALHDFTGDKAPFERLFALAQEAPDSVLSALIDCFTDTRVTKAHWHGDPVSVGVVCYATTRMVAYREDEAGHRWTGNIVGYPSVKQLQVAQHAWRDAVHRHEYMLP